MVCKGHLRGDAGLLGIIAKHTNAPALGELVVFVVQVFSHADALHHGPGLAGAQQGGWEDDSVEWHIVLAHELDQVHVLGALPPCLGTTLLSAC